MNAVLNHLDLECNRVGDAGAVAIAGALCVNKTIRVLTFSSNNKSYRATAMFKQCAVSTRRASYKHTLSQPYTRCSTSVPTVSVTQGLLRSLKVRK